MIISNHKVVTTFTLKLKFQGYTFVQNAKKVVDFGKRLLKSGSLSIQLLQQTSKIQHVWKHRSNLKLLRSSSHRRQNSICDRVITSTTSQNSNLSSIRLRRLGKRMQRRRLGRNVGAFAQGTDDAPDSASDLEYTSSSEQSCTTVIYLGRSHPLRKLNASDRSKRLANIEKKEVN